MLVLHNRTSCRGVFGSLVLNHLLGNIADPNGKVESNRSGYSLGVGGRYNFAPQMAVRLEYRYHGYSKFNMSNAVETWENKNKEHVMTVGLQYMF